MTFLYEILVGVPYTFRCNYWTDKCVHTFLWKPIIFVCLRDGWVRKRCVSYVTGARPATVGQGRLPLRQLTVEEECFYFFCFFTSIHFAFSPLFHLLYYLFYFSFSGRLHKVTRKGWCVVKPQLNKKSSAISSAMICEVFFYVLSLPSPDSRRAVVSFWRENVHSTG